MFKLNYLYYGNYSLSTKVNVYEEKVCIDVRYVVYRIRYLRRDDIMRHIFVFF